MRFEPTAFLGKPRAGQDRGLSSWSIGVLGVGGLLALILGLAVAVLPWQIAVGVVGLPLLLVLGSVKPLAAFVVALLLAFGVVPEFLVASLPFAGAQIRPQEIIIIFLAMLAFIWNAGRQGGLFALLRPFRWMFAVLALGVVVGFIKGYLFDHNPRALSDLRVFVGWLALPVALWLIRTRGAAVHRAVVGIGVLASALMCIQLATGQRLLMGFRGAELLSAEFSDVTRSAIGGGLFLVAYASYALYMRAADGGTFRWFAVLGCLLCLGGIAASFNRAVWAGFALGGLVVIVFRARDRRPQALVLVSLIALLAASSAVLVIAKRQAADAILDRVTSITQEGRRGTSLGFRLDENAQALERLREAPFVGVGLGGEYKHAYRQLAQGGGFDIEQSFVHNGYLSLWLKLGLFGLIFPLCYFVAALGSFRAIRGRASANPAALPAFAVTVVVAVSALTSPDWTSLTGTLAMATVLALLSCPPSARLPASAKESRRR